MPTVSAEVHPTNVLMHGMPTVLAEVHPTNVDIYWPTMISADIYPVVNGHQVTEEQLTRTGEVDVLEEEEIDSGGRCSINRTWDQEFVEEVTVSSPGRVTLQIHNVVSPGHHPSVGVRGDQEAWKRRKKKLSDDSCDNRSLADGSSRSMHQMRYGVEEAWARRRIKDMSSPSV